AGAEAQRRSETVAAVMRRAGLGHVEITADDDALWARQRAGQRSATRALVRIAARPSQLETVLGAVDLAAGTLVGRAALGISYVELDPEAVQRLRGELPPSAVVVLLDGPEELRAQPDPWGSREGPLLELMRRVKQRFDPARACNPGVFVGGI
ncbi:MAG: hypothetical protein M3Z06_00465, partial [Actinomycetota bacterium]|nr:hypothetical protein [Actinomycetota bacterium]